MNYKKLFKSRAIRSKILSKLNFIPDKTMVKLQYFIKLNRRLHLKNPKRFTEKLQWYKLYYRNPVMKQCANKYEVREYVKSKGLEDTLVKLYAHYDNVESIVWDELPDEFIIKSQTGGGGLDVLICHDKSEETRKKVCDKLAFTGTVTGSKGGGREWAYWNSPKGIVVEQLLVNKARPEAGIDDYKFYCFSGTPKFIHIDVDRYSDHKRNFYDTNWNLLDLESEYPNCDKMIRPPKNLDRMLEIASKLSEDFPFVRVDLYNIDGEIYFGELTFYPSSGYAPHKPDSADFMFGEDFELKEYKPNEG